MKEQKTKPRKKPKQERSQKTVDYILEGAARVLDKNGLKGLNTNAIAKEAGVSVGSLYQYFPTKEAIVAALINQYFQWQDEELLKCIEGLDKTLPLSEQAEIIVSKFYEIITSQPQISRLLLEQAENLKVANKLNELDNQLVSRLHDQISSLLPQVTISSVAMLVASVQGINDAYFRGKLYQVEKDELADRVTKMSLALLL